MAQNSPRLFLLPSTGSYSPPGDGNLWTRADPEAGRGHVQPGAEDEEGCRGSGKREQIGKGEARHEGADVARHVHRARDHSDVLTADVYAERPGRRQRHVGTEDRQRQAHDLWRGPGKQQAAKKPCGREREAEDRRQSPRPGPTSSPVERVASPRSPTGSQL